VRFDAGRSADFQYFQSAVSRISNPPALGSSQTLPTGRRRAEAAFWRAAKAESRRHSRLETVGNLRYFRFTKGL